MNATTTAIKTIGKSLLQLWHVRGHGDVALAVEVMGKGAFTFIEKLVNFIEKLVN